MNKERKTTETQVSHLMGLLKESLLIYEEILSGISEFKPEKLASVSQKIHLLKKETEDHDKVHVQQMPCANTLLKKKVSSIQESATPMLGSPSYSKVLGPMEEAIADFEKSCKSGCPPNRIIPKLVAHLSELCQPHDLLERIEEVINKQHLSDPEMARIKFQLGLEMEKRNHKFLALDLYKATSNIDTENKEIKTKCDALISNLSAGSRYDYLLNKKIVTADQLEKASAISRKVNKSVEFVLVDHFKVRKEEVGKSLSLFHDCPFKSFDSDVPVPVELVRNLKKSFLLYDLWVPLSWSPKGVEILVDNPGDLRKTDQIRGLMKTKKILFSVGFKEDIRQFITHFFDNKSENPIENMVEELDMIPDISFDEEEDTEEEQDIHDESSSLVVRFVDQVLISAYRARASDIHIEPSPIAKKTDIRFRIDGVCQEHTQVPNSMARGILSRLKVMAGLDIAERRLPQDGKIKFRRKGVPPFELRLATIPTTGGFEDVVLRILAKAGAMRLDEMGLSQRNMKIMKKIIAKPYGLILAVGPTGSGKTTTLHAALDHINKPGIKIWTAEDPVEITQRGLRQVDVKPKIGLDFARLMRSFLRADPDVIMIGEMRDHETASTGVEASLTGHLVFSTLHTNNAAETVTRLLDLGLNPLNFSDAFLGVLAQRLVRRLCTDCREQYHPSIEEFEEIAAEYGREQFKALKTKYTRKLTLYRPMGCELCSGTGYRGRAGIHELMEGTPEIKRLIKKQAPSETLFAQAIKEGMTTLKQDGIHKVLMGVTDINEVRRVCID